MTDSFVTTHTPTPSGRVKPAALLAAAPQRREPEISAAHSRVLGWCHRRKNEIGVPRTLSSSAASSVCTSSDSSNDGPRASTSPAGLK